MSHRRISRGARRHLLSVVERLAAPLMVVTVSGGKLADGATKKLRQFIEERLRGRANFDRVLVVPAEPGSMCRVSMRATASHFASRGVSVVAGKGGRRRGLRGRSAAAPVVVRRVVSAVETKPVPTATADSGRFEARTHGSWEPAEVRDPMRAHVEALDRTMRRFGVAKALHRRAR